jgi:threonine/homoserine/homoserine lactone efflux protein
MNQYRQFDIKNWAKLLPLKTGVSIMLEEYENKKRKQISQMRSVMDYGMGILIVLAGLFFLFHDKFNIPIGNNSSSWIDKFFGGLCLLYGGWRIYRGYKKNYFR